MNYRSPLEFSASSIRNEWNSVAIPNFVLDRHLGKCVRRLLALAPLATTFLPNVALAQSAGAEAGGQIEDVVVTAPSEVQAVTQQQLQQVQATRASTTILTARQLQAAQITDLRQATRLQPGLNVKFQNVRNIAINVRGFGASSSSATDAIFGGTPVYVNGVYQPFVGQAVFNMPDLEGFEVRKGPQATGGGQDNTGGAVYITTALPSFVAAQNLQFQYGSYNWFQVQGSATGPIADSDKAAFRFSFFGQDREGYIRSTTSEDRYNSTHDKAANINVLLTPSNDLTALLTASYSHSSQACCVSGFAGVVDHYTNGQAVSNNYYQRSARIGQSVPSASQWINTYTTQGQGWQNTSQDNYVASAKIDYTFNDYKLTSVTSFTQWDFHPHNGFQLTPGVSYIVGSGSQVTARSVVQDIKFSTPTGGPVEAAGGVFLLWSRVMDWGKSAYGPLAGSWYGNTSYSQLVNDRSLNYLMRSAYDNPETYQVSPYVQATYHATPDVDITGGVRYSYVYKRSNFSQWLSSEQSLDGLSIAQQAQARALRVSQMGANTNWYADTHQGMVSALFTATYKFTPDIYAYVTASQGGRAGGPNVPMTGNIADTVPRTVKAERIENYEVGLKTSWFDQRVTANIAAFTMFNHNYITQATNVIGATAVTYLANAELAQSRGIELDVRAQATEELTFYGSLVYDDAFYGSFTNSPCPFEVKANSCDLSGQPISNTPKWSFAIGGEYVHDLGSFLQPATDKPVSVYFGADFAWQSRFYSDTSNSVYSQINPYGVLNLHGGLRFNDESLDISGWVHNALDKRFYNIIAPTTAGLISAQLGDPLMAGFTIRAKF